MCVTAVVKKLLVLDLNKDPPVPNNIMVRPEDGAFVSLPEYDWTHSSGTLTQLKRRQAACQYIPDAVNSLVVPYMNWGHLEEAVIMYRTALQGYRWQV